jgi:HK97 gp10 family phage protein
MITINKNPNVMDAIIDGVEKGIASICAAVEGQAVSFADGFADTGNLRNSITWKTSKSMGGGNQWEGMPEPKTLEGYVGSPVEYAVYQEFGTRRMRPQPYLRPAIAMKALGQRGADVMVKRIQEVAKGKLVPGAMSDRETFGVGGLK